MPSRPRSTSAAWRCSSWSASCRPPRGACGTARTPARTPSIRWCCSRSGRRVSRDGPTRRPPRPAACASGSPRSKPASVRRPSDSRRRAPPTRAPDATPMPEQRRYAASRPSSRSDVPRRPTGNSCRSICSLPRPSDGAGASACGSALPRSPSGGKAPRAGSPTWKRGWPRSRPRATHTASARMAWPSSWTKRAACTPGPSETSPSWMPRSSRPRRLCPRCGRKPPRPTRDWARCSSSSATTRACRKGHAPCSRRANGCRA